jgi:hypothetical protein
MITKAMAPRVADSSRRGKGLRRAIRRARTVLGKDREAGAVRLRAARESCSGSAPVIICTIHQEALTSGQACAVN